MTRTDALAKAVKVAGRARDILNIDQGCQCTSAAWTGEVWRSLKCEDIYLKDYPDLVELEQGVANWMEDY